MYKLMEKEIERMQMQLDHAKKELKRRPEGVLHCCKCKKTFQYRIDGKYLRKRDIHKAVRLAKRDYYEDLIPVLEKGIEALTEARKYLPGGEIDEVYNRLCDGRKALLKDLPYKSIEETIADFNAMVRNQGDKRRELDKEYYTEKGEQVRSKSEVIIADTLNHAGISYKYEWPLVLYDKGSKVTCHPDFLVLNKSTGQPFFIEHLGMMSDPGYASDAIKRLALYENNGYHLGKSLLILYETNEMPLSTKLVRSLIEEYLL